MVIFQRLKVHSRTKISFSQIIFSIWKNLSFSLCPCKSFFIFKLIFLIRIIIKSRRWAINFLLSFVLLKTLRFFIQTKAFTRNRWFRWYLVVFFQLCYKLMKFLFHKFSFLNWFFSQLLTKSSSLLVMRIKAWARNLGF